MIYILKCDVTYIGSITKIETAKCIEHCDGADSIPKYILDIIDSGKIEEEVNEKVLDNVVYFSTIKKNNANIRYVFTTNKYHSPQLNTEILRYNNRIKNLKELI